MDENNAKQMTVSGSRLSAYRKSPTGTRQIWETIGYNGSRRNGTATQEEFAEFLQRLTGDCDFSQSTVKRYENGKTLIKPVYAEALAQKTGWVPEYWRGITRDAKTQAEWDEEQVRYGYKEFTKVIEETTQRYRGFFSLIGFHYEYLPSALEDFAEVDGEPIPGEPGQQKLTGRHYIERYDAPDSGQVFSMDDFFELIGDIGKVIDLACYKKSRV